MLQSSYHGVHQVSGVRALSPAYQCGKLQEGDELVQVNYQTVVSLSVFLMPCSLTGTSSKESWLWQNHPQVSLFGHSQHISPPPLLIHFTGGLSMLILPLSHLHPHSLQNHPSSFSSRVLTILCVSHHPFNHSTSLSHHSSTHTKHPTRIIIALCCPMGGF